ncbi:putative Ig domain-containing protein, partial [Microbacterium sp.]|uniref:putative Ig domain-containing protein n=1 Tax=Microbacterium sp. TaxID=51671 RepID=UPI00261A0EF6
MHPSRSSTAARFRTRATRIITAATLVTSAVLVPVSASAAAPIVVDDFSGTQIAAPAVTLSDGGGTSTMPTSTALDGAHRFELFGNGNSVTSASLAYTFAEVDLTSAGSNTQFMVGLDSVTRGPDLPDGQTAVSAQIEVSDAHGAVGQYSTGFANVADFDLVLNFDCTAGSTVCFSGNIDFTRVTGITLTFFYPSNYDSGRSTVVVIDELRTTPTGGSQPPAPAPAITLDTPTTSGTVWAEGSTELVYSVDFRSNGANAEMATVDLSGSSLETTGSLAASITDISGSGGSFEITVGVTSGSGSLRVVVPAGSGTDTWGQSSTTAESSAVSIEQGTTPAIEAQSFTVHHGQDDESTLAASGTPTPTFGATTALPAGFTLAADGTLSASDAAVGTYAFTVQVTNPLGVDQATVNVTVDELAFTSAAAATFDSTQESDFTVTWEAPDGTTISGYDQLPAGLTATPGGNSLTISGMPDRAGSGVTVLPLVLTPVAGDPVTQDLALTVNAPPLFTGSMDFIATVGEPFSATVTSQGWPVAELTLADALPTGLTFDDNGDGTATISGEATEPAPSSAVTVTADNGSATTSAELTFSVYSEPMIAPLLDQSVEIGTTVSVPLVTSGVPAPVVSASDLPGWITLNGSIASGWALVASPTSSDEAATITLQATNAASSVSTQVSFTPYAVPEVSGPESIVFVAGAPVADDAVYAVSGSPAPDIDVAGLPAGVSAQITDDTVTLEGEPETPGSYSATITATNSYGGSVFDISVTVDEVPAISPIVPVETPVGMSFTKQVRASGQPTPALAATGLPNGVTFTDNGDGTGTISGTAGSPGDSTATITATNRSGAVSTTFALTATAAPQITSDAAVGFESGVADEFTITVEAYPAPTIALVGTLPDGLVFADNGDGTATITGTADVPVRERVKIVADNATDAAEQTLVVTVWNAPEFTSTPTAAFTVGESGQQQISATGFPTPALSLAGTLPAGLTFVDNGDGTGMISGTPASDTAGTFEVNLTATISIAQPTEQTPMAFALLAAGDEVSTQQTLQLTVAP